MNRGIFLVAALALTACPTGKKCTTNADCTGGQVCSVMSGTCVTGTGTGGGIGGGGGGTGAGGGSGGGSTGGGNGGGSAGGTGGGANNGAETCEMAMTITAGTLSGSTVGTAPDYDPGCTGDVTPGPDTVYKISVPAGQRLSATATPELTDGGNNQYDLALYLIQGPASNCTNADGGAELECLAASDDPDLLPTAETARWFNSSAAPVDVFIVVDSFFDAMRNLPDGGVGAAQEGNFTLVTEVSAPPMGDRCDTAVALVSGTPLTNQNTANFGNDYTGSGPTCSGTTKNDIAYQIDVPAGQVLTLVVTPVADFDPIVSISDGAAACDMTCIDSMDDGFEGDTETLSYKNASTAAQSIFVVIDGWNEGVFGIAATLVSPPADDVCTAPIALTAGTPLTAQTISNYANDFTTGTGCGYAAGNDRVYSIAVPDGQRVIITATPTTLANPSLSLVDGAANCATACVASGTAGITGAVETLAFTNRTGAAKTYLVVVDFSSSSTGTFDINAVLGTPPADDVCQAPTVVTAGTPLNNQSTLGYTNDYQNGTGTLGCATSGATGLDRVYQISIPANQRGIVTVTPEADAGYNPSINLVEGAAAVCAAMPRLCATGSNSAAANVAETLPVYNTTANPKTYFAIIDSTTGGGNFNIGYTVGTPVANDTCTTNAATLTAGTLAAQNLTGFESDYAIGTNCGGARGPDRVYKVPLTANQRFTGTVTPTTPDGGFDPVLSFIAGPAANCEAAPRTCNGGVDAKNANEPETGIFTNNTGAALDLFVVVADWKTDSTGRDFSILSAISTVPAGETCGLPLVQGTGMLTGQNTFGFTSDVVFAATATGCESTGRSSDVIYSITIPAMKTLTVTVTPATSSEDMIINIIEGTALTCNNVTACVASADATGSGAPETATFTNSTAAPKTVFVQVAGYMSSMAGFSLNVQIP